MPGGEIKLLVAIVDRGVGSAVAEALEANALTYSYACMGAGTANSIMLDYLGLSETLKDVVFSFSPASSVRVAMDAVNDRVDFSHPGRGILFSMPLSGVSGQIHQSLAGDCAIEPKEDAMESAETFELVVAVVERGYLDAVMEAARSAGARGGTVLHGRRIALEDGESLLGVSLEPEKDIVAMVVKSPLKLEVMRAVNKAAGASSPARGVLFSLPVETMMGIRDFDAPDADDQPANSEW